MDEPTRQTAMPPKWRVIAAFLIAPLVAASVYGAISPLYAGLPNVFDRVLRTGIAYLVVGAYPSAGIIGLPMFLASKRRIKPTALNCAIAGIIVASLPWLVLGLLGTADYSYDHGHVTAIHGQKTLWGWIYLAEGIGQVALMGLLGGLVFWLVGMVGLKTPKVGSA